MGACPSSIARDRQSARLKLNVMAIGEQRLYSCMRKQLSRRLPQCLYLEFGAVGYSTSPFHPGIPSVRAFHASRSSSTGVCMTVVCPLCRLSHADAQKDATGHLRAATCSSTAVCSCLLLHHMMMHNNAHRNQLDPQVPHPHASERFQFQASSHRHIQNFFFLLACDFVKLSHKMHLLSSRNLQAYREAVRILGSGDCRSVDCRQGTGGDGGPVHCLTADPRRQAQEGAGRSLPQQPADVTEVGTRRHRAVGLGVGLGGHLFYSLGMQIAVARHAPFAIREMYRETSISPR